MYTQFKLSKSPSISKKLAQPKGKCWTLENNKKSEKHIGEDVNEEQRKSDVQAVQGIRKLYSKKSNTNQNIYYISTCVQTDEQPNLRAIKSVSKRRQLTKKKIHPNTVQALPSEGSISSISLKRKHFTDSQNYKTNEKNKANPERKAFLIQRNKSPKSNRQNKIKNISTKTSIKEIQLIRFSHQITPQITPQKQPSSKNQQKKPIKQSTLKIAMKHMFYQLQSTRQENSLLKEQLINIKSHEYYYLNREKVREMIVELQKQKELRKNVQKQNITVKEQNVKLKQQNSMYKKENYRMKRINAQMKDQIAEINQENIIMRQRVNHGQTNSLSDDFSKD